MILGVLLTLVAASCSPAATTGSGPGADPVVQRAAPAVEVPPAPEDSDVAGVRAAPAPTTLPTAAPTAAPAIDYQRVGANALGTIPILEYHLVVDAEEDQWAITPEHFRRTLQQLYDAGFRPISMADFLDRRIDLPAGLSPVVLTFDDSSPGQFRFLERDGQLVVDPNCAVGIMEAFHAAHPDFALRGVFYVLPEAEQPHKMFGQPEHEAGKLRYLVDRGFEIGNHTYWHQRLDVVDDEEVQRQIALAIREIQKVLPGYRLRTMALPEGMWPENHALAIDGSFEGITYRNEAILEVASDPAPSPFSRDFDPSSVQRVQVFGENLEMWLRYLANHPDERYVSSGDPNVVAFPKRLEQRLNPASVGNRRVQAY